MIVDPKVVGHNIRKLRKLYGETQSQLGSVIGLYGTAVSLIEQGKRCNPDTIALIARHYGLSASFLIDGDLDLSQASDASSLFRPISLIVEALLHFFAGSSPEGSDFRKACDECSHIAEFDPMPDDMIETQRRVIKCIITFLQSVEDYPAEASANAAAGTVLLYFLAEDSGTSFLRAACKDNPNMSDEDFIKLLPTSFDLRAAEESSQREVLISELHMDVIDYLYSLRQEPSPWPDYADYYAALLYLAGLTDSYIDLETSMTVGREMIATQAFLGNEYSMGLLERLMELYEKS